MAGEILQKLHGLGAAAIVGPVALGRQVRHGQLVYRNIPELWQAAVLWTIDADLPLTPANIRKSAKKVITAGETMVDDGLDILYDGLGHSIEDRETVLAPPRNSSQRPAATQRVTDARVRELLELGGIDPSLADDPEFPF